MNIQYTDSEVMFTFPRFAKRCNPYGSDEENESGAFGLYPTFTGLIIRQNKNGNDWNEMGFAATIDMDYKGKGDQVGDFIVKWHGEEKEFLAKCKELEIDVHEIEV